MSQSSESGRTTSITLEDLIAASLRGVQRATEARDLATKPIDKEGSIISHFPGGILIGIIFQPPINQLPEERIQGSQEG